MIFSGTIWKPAYLYTFVSKERSAGSCPVFVILIIFFLNEFITTFPKSQIKVETTIFSKILKLYLSAELIIVLFIRLGSCFGWLSSFMFLRIISQNTFLSISVSILFEICSALCCCSLVRLSSVVLPGMSIWLYFSS